MKKFLTLVSVLLVTACASDGPQGDRIGEVDTLYNQAMNLLQNGDYTEAVHTFEELERQHPYSGWATRAQMMVAFAHYKVGNYDEALVNIDRFISLHPGHKDLPYMYYLRGLSYYEQISDVKRDQGYTERALQAFNEVVNRFPDSEYARDARFKITLCNDHLAGKEMMVGRFYQEKQRHLAAINRFKTVVKEYEKTSQTPEALYRLVESYLSLGLENEAKKAGAVLGHNFPASDWYKDAYQLLTQKDLAPKGKKDSWAKGMWDGVKDIF